MPDKKIASFALLCLLFASLATAKSIKCVDSKGITHYGDTIPAECSDKAVIELDDKGLPVKETPASLTPEERRAMEVEVQKQADEAQKEKEQQRRDSTLLSTYANEAEIDMARDRNIQQLSLSLSNVESRIKTVKNKLDQYGAHAESFTGANKPVPADLEQNISAAKREISDMEVERVQKQQDLATMKAKYDADKKRFRELTQKQPEKQQ